MSFLAKMFVHDRVINVLHTNIHLYQQCDPSTHQPNAKTNGGLFQVVIEADEHTDLLNTVISGTMCSGYIRFFKRDGMSKLIDYEFFDAYIIDISTHFNAYSPDPMTDTLTFSPGILRFGDVIYEKWWKVTDLNRETVEPTVIEDDNPQILESYFEDENNETVYKPKKDQNITLVIKSQNMIGKYVDIDLGDSDIEFEHNGELLEEDILREHRITSDFMRIQLKTIKRRQ